MLVLSPLHGRASLGQRCALSRRFSPAETRVYVRIPARLLLIYEPSREVQRGGEEEEEEEENVAFSDVSSSFLFFLHLSLITPKLAGR